MVKDFSFNASNICLVTFTFALIMVEKLMCSAFSIYAFASAGFDVPEKIIITVNRLATTLACVGAAPPVKIVWASLWAAFTSTNSLVPNLTFIAYLGSAEAHAGFNIKILKFVHIPIEVKARSRIALARA